VEYVSFESSISSLDVFYPLKSNTRYSARTHLKARGCASQKSTCRTNRTRHPLCAYAIYEHRWTLRKLFATLHTKQIYFDFNLTQYILLFIISQAIVTWPNVSNASQLSVTPYTYGEEESGFIFTEVDYLDDNNIPVLTRHFNSKNTHWDIGLGPGWLTNFHRRVLAKNSQRVNILDSNGMILVFTSAEVENRWNHPEKGYIELDNGKIVWHATDGFKYVFNGPHLISIVNNNYRKMTLIYKNKLLYQVKLTEIQNQIENSSKYNSIYFRYKPLSKSSTINPKIQSVFFDSEQILKYSYNGNQLRNVLYSTANRNIKEKVASWSSDYINIAFDDNPHPLLERVRSNHTDKVEYRVVYDETHTEFRIWKTQNNTQSEIYNSLNDNETTKYLKGSNSSTSTQTSRIPTIMTMKRALKAVLNKRSDKHIPEFHTKVKSTSTRALESDNIHQFYTVTIPGPTCTNCKTNVIVVAVDSTGHMTGLAFNGKATTWDIITGSNPTTYYTTTYKEQGILERHNSIHSSVKKLHKHSSAKESQQLNVVKTKIIQRDLKERPVTLESDDLGTVKVDYSPDSILVTHQSINQIKLADNSILQPTRLSRLHERQTRIGLAGKETKRILAIELFRRNHDTNSCQIITSEPTIFSDLEPEPTNATNIDSALDDESAYDCQESENIANIREETHSAQFSTLGGLSTQFLDITPANCQSFFEIPNAIQRGSLIENAVAQSDRYSSALSTVRWFPSIDFVQDRTAIVQTSRDLTATTYIERPDRLYNILVREAELVNTRFLEPLTLNGHVTAIDGNQSTTIRQNDIDQIRMEIIIQQGEATDEQLIQISRAALEIMNVHGITLEIIEIP